MSEAPIPPISIDLSPLAQLVGFILALTSRLVFIVFTQISAELLHQILIPTLDQASAMSSQTVVGAVIGKFDVCQTDNVCRKTSG